MPDEKMRKHPGDYLAKTGVAILTILGVLIALTSFIAISLRQITVGVMT